jgi:hypothetical protein
MTKSEYQNLQVELSYKIDSLKYTGANTRYNEGYKDGILVAKSILHSFYKSLETKRV